jgi:hypothetical protein
MFDPAVSPVSKVTIDSLGLREADTVIGICIALVSLAARVVALDTAKDTKLFVLSDELLTLADTTTRAFVPVTNVTDGPTVAKSVYVTLLVDCEVATVDVPEADPTSLGRKYQVFVAVLISVPPAFCASVTTEPFRVTPTPAVTVTTPAPRFRSWITVPFAYATEEKGGTVAVIGLAFE